MTGKKKQEAVPSSRLGRFARVAKIAGGVAGGMLAEGSRQLRAGRRPSARDLLLTPGNARRVADELASMRGAAMKLGQIISMDGGDFLPRELADVLARLRSGANTMPAAQLQEVMVNAYGEDWEELFYGFDAVPIAAASIGQVHRAVAPDGRKIAIKVQYPGVARSIDSDVDNIAGVLRLSGLLPSDLDITPLLEEAKAQLKDEANYLSEADHLASFGDLLADDDDFVVPEVLPEYCHEQVLVMTYAAGAPLESLEEASQDERNRVVSALMGLMFRELFELRLVQTDPNFANYRYRPDSGEIVLLDFGATRRFKAAFVNDYKRLLKAARRGDEKRLLLAADKLGYAVADASDDYRQLVLDLFLLALECFSSEGPYDFGASDVPARMAELAETVQDFREFWQVPPTDVVFFHRKLGGMFLLANRMNASVDMHSLVSDWV